MSFLSTMIGAAERIPLPDVVIRAVIHELCARTAARLAIAGAANDAAFARALASRPIAEPVDARSRQTELPATFFAEVLGPNRKYSCCFYKEPASTLQEAEEEALRQTVTNADLQDGQSILELGCGWGSLCLWIARQFPHARVTAVTNSHLQRRFIEDEATARGLTNLSVVTSDMDLFAPATRFDRIVSVQTLEHVLNWRALLTLVRAWLAPEGRFFAQVFAHRTGAYLLDRSDRADWIAQHFFDGRVMPSHGLIRRYGDLLAIEKEWRWSGTHYQRTALDWLANFDAHRERIEAILLPIHGGETHLWMRRWRWFFLAIAGLSGFDGGNEWGVSQYRMAAV
ncbi:SAM-dependent methyltransferase [Bradyrhizobium sp. STM 3557]|uniref:SAM-dependent methyltransferase n=1 Tax=Bradyrhizobium sp. STM 3557 TaxID=578920 RepID=UPI00388E9A02